MSSRPLENSKEANGAQHHVHGWPELSAEHFHCNMLQMQGFQFLAAQMYKPEYSWLHSLSGRNINSIKQLDRRKDKKKLDMYVST